MEIDISRLRDLAMAASPGPWRECGHERGGCTCGSVSAVPGDHPVATVTIGAWGDSWPEIAPNVAEGEPQAYMKRIDYGEVSDHLGKANAAYIAAVDPATILALLDELVMLRAVRR
jgi:hypothetical protein